MGHLTDLRHAFRPRVPDGHDLAVGALVVIAVLYGLVVWQLVEQHTRVDEITRIIKGQRGPRGKPGTLVVLVCPYGSKVDVERRRCLAPKKPTTPLFRPAP